MPALTNEADRTDVLNRLRRAEGQLRGIQRMIEEGESCLPIASKWRPCARPWTAPTCA
jgi:DNA-binding FrmR family transcriptional regulator